MKLRFFDLNLNKLENLEDFINYYPAHPPIVHWYQAANYEKSLKNQWIMLSF